MRFLLLFMMLCPLAAGAYAQDIAFPADAGFINVRDFGAKGDGKSDDTAAINAALAASGEDTGRAFWQDKIVYIPKGTYLVSGPLLKRYANGSFASGIILIGQSREGSVIKLKDRAPGYGEAKAVIFTSSKLLDGAGDKDYVGKGEGNDAYANFIENITVDTGAGNPGAIGIDYLANNLGAVRNVTVRGDGMAGISMTRKWPGPALIQDVTVKGFAVGIDVAQTEYGITMERVTLLNQRDIGLRNNRNVVSAREVTVQGAPVSVANSSPDGLIVLAGGQLDGRFENKGSMNMRDVKAQDGTVIDGVYDKHVLLSPSRQAWSLPVESPPPAPVSKRWVAVKNKGDATAAIRAAFASGAATIYFPHGIYHVNGNIDVPPTVRRIVGMMSTLRLVGARAPGFKREAGIFRVRGGLQIEKLAFDNTGMGKQVAVEALGVQAVVLRDVVGMGVTTLKRTQHAGKAFIENTCCGLMEFDGPQGVWARQLNSEGGGTRIRNNGAPLWLLGIKTERNCTVLDGRNGAVSEILGGLLYMVRTDGDDLPAFYNEKSKLLVSYAEEAFDEKAVYKTHLMGDAQSVTADTLPPRGKGRMAAQLVSE